VISGVRGGGFYWTVAAFAAIIYLLFTRGACERMDWNVCYDDLIQPVSPAEKVKLLHKKGGDEMV